MAAFIQIFPDPLSLNQSGLTGTKVISVDLGSTPKFDHVRRPVRGIMLKDDTYATLEVKTKNGKNILLFDSGGSHEVGDISYSPKISNFLIQNIQESSVEKSQIVETFGPAYVFFFGTRPNMLNVNGILLNTADFNWKNEFWANYETYLKGTMCVSNNTRVQLSYDDIVVTGYIMSVNANVTADLPEAVNFSFQMVMNTPVFTTTIGESEFPTKTYVNILPDSDSLANSDTTNLSNPVAGDNSRFLNNVLGGSTSLNYLYGENSQQYKNYLVSYIDGGNINIPLSNDFADDSGQPIKYKYGTFSDYKVVQATFGKIRDNEDEYIARVGTAKDAISQLAPPESLNQQYQSQENVEIQATRNLQDYGINIQDPNILSSILSSGSFGTLNIGRSVLTSKLETSNPQIDDIQQALIEQIHQRINR